MQGLREVDRNGFNRSSSKQAGIVTIEHPDVRLGGQAGTEAAVGAIDQAGYPPIEHAREQAGGQAGTRLDGSGSQQPVPLSLLKPSPSLNSSIIIRGTLRGLE